MTPSNYSQGSYGMKFKYDVDIVLCIDATASMSPVIDMVKKNVQKLPNDILKEAQSQKKIINNLRLRLIVFRDYAVDGAHAMEATDFFQVPEEQELFNQTVNGIVADGGGDEPENGLEALAYAMASDWKKEEQGQKRRQIIVVWTDASTHDLGHGRKESKFYDPNMPTDFETLTSWWGSVYDTERAKMGSNEKRLLLYAPKTERHDGHGKEVTDWWDVIAKNWENVISTNTVAGQGLQEQKYAEIIYILVKSI